MRTKRTVINFIVTIVLQIITGLCGLIVPKIFITIYGSEVNGMISSINQFLSYITLFEGGLSGIIISQLYKPIANNDVETFNKLLADARDFFKKIVYIYCIYVVILIVIYPLVINSTKSYIYISSLILILSINLLLQYLFGITNNIYLQAKQKGYISTTLQIIVVLFNALAVILCCKMNLPVHILKILTIIIAAISPIGMYFYIKTNEKNINLNLKGNYRGIEQKKDGLIHHFCYYIQNNIDIFLLTFVNLKEVSVYSIYFMIISTIRKIFEAFLTSFRSAMGDMYAKNDKKSLVTTFSVLEFLIYTLTVSIFTALYYSITPFIRLYAKGITDVNYINQPLAILFILAEICYTIRIPYHTMVNCTGIFRETKKFALQEAILNIGVSSILVFKIGIIGVVIGTAVSCAFRTIQYFNYFTKNLLFLSWKKIIKRVLVQIVAATIIILLFNILNLNSFNYLEWMLHGIIYLFISSIIAFVINSIVFKEDMLVCIDKIRKKLQKSYKGINN